MAALLLQQPIQSEAKTLILEGGLQSRIQAVQRVNFSVSKEVRSMTFRFAIPATFSNKGTSQKVEGLEIQFAPKPASVTDETDSFGNTFKKAKWEDVSRDIAVTISYRASIESRLRPMQSAAALPLKDIPREDAVFLQPTSMVQSEDKEILSLSRELTDGALTEYEAVEGILNWVSDNVKYTYNPPKYDALYTMKTGSGNCQNFAHLSMALLRASGIPSRIVGGVSLKRQWKVPVENGYLVQDMGQGGHAWMEIYFPDLGWLSYDPQQSRQFTSTRHIKQTHGLDSKDINDSWSAAPYLPEYGESISADFEVDETDIRLDESKDAPRAYIISNNFAAKAAAAPAPVVAVIPMPAPEGIPLTVPEPLPEPKPQELSKPAPEEIKKEPKPAPKPKPAPRLAKGPVELGNMEFPHLVDVYRATGNEATRILDKETAEYATSKYVYAQAFEIEDALSLEGVSLAMRKFGGDGSLYADVVMDENGKPGLSGARSMPVPLSDIKFQPGYYWVDFSFPGIKGVMPPGRYWIILRHSGEAIANWFYIPGNPYGDGDDTRSTVKGYKWEDILNYDFVFKVKGIIK